MDNQKIRCIHLPLNVPGSEQVGQTKGFDSVFDCRHFDYLTMEGEMGKEETNRALESLVEAFNPSVMWYQRQETGTITKETLEKIRKENPDLFMTTWSGDARSYPPPSLTQIFPSMDVFYNDTDQEEMYRPFLGECQYKFMPIAVDPDEATAQHEIGEVPEVVFIGNNYNGSFTNSGFRYELMKTLSRELKEKFGVYGTGWPMSDVNILGSCPVKHQGAYYRKAKVVVSVDHIESILHWSERLIWALASGSEVVVQNQPGLKNIFKNRLNYFDTPEECVELCKKLAEQPKETNQRNIDYILLTHTWKQRAEQVRKDYLEWKSKN